MTRLVSWRKRIVARYLIEADSLTSASPAAALPQEHRRSHSGIGLGDHLIVAPARTEGRELAPLKICHYLVFSALLSHF